MPRSFSSDFDEPLLNELPAPKVTTRARTKKVLAEPDAATQVLFSRLSDRDWQVRVRAAEALSACSDPAVVPHLAAALQSPDFRLRRAAAEALGKRGSEGVDALLTSLTHKTLEVRQAALMGLRAAGNGSVAHILSVLDERSLPRRRAAVEALTILRSHDAIPALIECLGDIDTELRWRAASALGELQAPAATEPLLLLLGDLIGQVRWAAATALGQIASPRALGPLLAALQDDEPTVRAASAWALGEIGDPYAIESLIARLGDEPDVCLSIVRALGRLHVDPLLLAPHLRSGVLSVRLAVIEALVAIANPVAVKALITALDDPSAELRHAIVEGLVTLGPLAEPALSARLNKATGWTASATRDALDRIWKNQRRAA